MIRDLQASGSDEARQADVLVLGAGIVGLLIATRLARRGQRVIVLESGGEHQAEDTHPLNEVDQLGAIYAGAAHGRFRCLGGTSTRWGGAMIPLLRADLEQSTETPWPVPYDELMAYVPELERLFGLPPGPYEAPGLVSSIADATPQFLPRFAKWPPFRLRNVANLLNAEIRADKSPEIWLNATATEFEIASDGQVSSITAVASNGQQRRLRVSADQIVVSAGAVESTRLLLLADRATGDRIYAPHDVLGRYFHDHLSIEVANIVPSNRRKMNRVVGFRFEKGGMRNLRFEPSEDSTVRRQIAPCFAHINFSESDGSAFDTLREIYRHLQQRRLPDLGTMVRLVGGAPWLMRAAWWRFVEHRLLYPDGADLRLHMVIEQSARRENRILLSEGRRDLFGTPLAAIDWHVSQEDKALLTSCVDQFFEYWRETDLGKLGSLVRYPEGVAEERMSKGGGIYHPGGSTRMGRSINDGVVDADLRCFGLRNVSVAATSVFPSGGGANPTMMLMLAGLRLADRLHVNKRQSGSST